MGSSIFWGRYCCHFAEERTGSLEDMVIITAILATADGFRLLSVFPPGLSLPPGLPDRPLVISQGTFACLD